MKTITSPRPAGMSCYQNGRFWSEVLQCKAPFARLLNACVLGLMLLMVNACAQDGGTRQPKLLLPFDFTDEERAQFTEALDKFPKRWMPELIRATPLSEMRWLDNRRMVLSVRELPGWKAQPEEPSRIAVLDTDTGAVEATPYQGELKCLSHEGKTMIRLTSRGQLEGLRENDDTWLVGQWGQPLQKAEWKPGHFAPNWLCSFGPVGGDLYTPGAETRNPEGYRDVPLLPQHGFLRETIARDARGLVVHPITLHKPDGRRVSLPGPPPLPISMRYQPWNDTYFQGAATGGDGQTRTLDPAGSRVLHVPPPMLAQWDALQIGSAGSRGTRLGVLWAFAARTSYWRKQGMYLQAAEGLLRIDEGSNGTEVEISPDGCRIVSHNRKWDPSRPGGPRARLLLIDLCSSGGKK
ncbi:MAG TPA: hypothetical protein VGJ72_05710 [Polaromonas sp.]|jgi:hypothetical protein